MRVIDVARVLLATTGDNGIAPTSSDDYIRILESARRDRCGRHELVADPSNADLILFIGARESDFWDVRTEHVVRRYRERCFLYHSEDRILPFLPGIYPSLLERDNVFGRAMGGGYSAVLHIDIPTLPFDPRARYLFSFLGKFASNPGCRERLRELRGHPRGCVENVPEGSGGTSLHAP
ncbi:MAG TPA: hypothetical protein VKF32_14005, partial [Thermoanaerobaculia bacterium]|nr:hypothetical protein [Thermoanaerobaculia bacterium]